MPHFKKIVVSEKNHQAFKEFALGLKMTHPEAFSFMCALLFGQELPFVVGRSFYMDREEKRNNDNGQGET